ncbi:hypothetical protein AN477_11665 [Alicyclobacillus ferrooxydans]|uniref:Uncharacterized protein n=1 Tax=Alicyclobacillus ferrooxydans TaxID=471514 RepID=A0A0N8PP68_9BACL|nr:hypothetical protein [Alicyclobacillus ferrooxydans]KPV43485.1 hypothetical protein AN477_11665 [Alicyclobacillus ferrooxydans]
MKNSRRYVISGITIILALILYYVIDYAVVANNVRSHVKSALSTTIQSVGQLTPSLLTMRSWSALVQGLSLCFTIPLHAQSVDVIASLDTVTSLTNCGSPLRISTISSTV